MGIKVKHSPSAAAIGGTAYTIGRGQKKRYAAEIGLKQQGLDLQRMSIGAQAQARMAAIKQREAESERLHGLREDELGFRRQQWEDEPARQLQKGMEAQKLLQGQESYEYTESQKRRRAQVIEGINWLREQVASGKWTAEQAEQAEQQLWGLFHKIIPGLVDVGPGVQQRFDNSIATALDGSQWREESPGKFERMGMTEKDWDKSYDDSYKTLTSANMGIPPEPKEVEKYMKSKRAMYAQYQAMATQTKQEKIRMQQMEEQDAAEEEQELQTQAAVEEAKEDLQLMFDAVVKGKLVEPTVKPSKGLKRRPVDFKGAPAGMTYPYKHKFYGEEKYKESLNKAIERGKTEGVTPEEIKVEFDKWWDSQDKELFGDRMEFEGAAQGATAFPKGATAFPKREGEELGDVPQPKTKAEYDKLKPGTRYIDPDGVERIKR
jgi:hypothetical protein